MQAGENVGQFRPGYEAFSQLLQQIAHGQHQSCLLITSREQPIDFRSLRQDLVGVEALFLAGLPLEAGQDLLQMTGLFGSQRAIARLIVRYSGNPLALKLISRTVQDFAFGDIDTFLKENTLIFADMRHILDQQFERLTSLEQTIMIWMAIEREPVSPQVLHDNLIHLVTRRILLEALQGLHLRSLIEKHEQKFGLQNVVLEYISDYLITRIGTELSLLLNLNKLFEILRLTTLHLNTYALCKAQATDYVRDSQTRLILQPISEALLSQWGRFQIERGLQQILQALQATAPLTPGYLASNILHLLLCQETDLRGYDFSKLTLWQADLRGIRLSEVNLSQADLTQAAFTANPKQSSYSFYIDIDGYRR